MIVELLGPPGAGKSTFARALAESILRHGAYAEIASSARPNETNGSATTAHIERAVRFLAGNALLRLIRATTQFCDNALADKRAGCLIADRLFEIFPQKGALRSFRLAQYMKRLSGRWQLATSAKGITIFDQAYAQALLSYAALSRRKYKEALAEALRATPKADLLIYLEAPYATLVQRLEKRAEAQGWLERRLELDLKSNLGAIDVAACLYGLATEEGLRIMKGRSDDQTFLAACVGEIRRLSAPNSDLLRHHQNSGAPYRHSPLPLAPRPHTGRKMRRKSRTLW